VSEYQRFKKDSIRRSSDDDDDDDENSVPLFKRLPTASGLYNSMV
jgi:hypothetical protein